MKNSNLKFFTTTFIMLLVFCSFVTTSSAQCVDSMESKVDCCTIIDIYADCGGGTTKIGTMYDATSSSICGSGCYAPLGTTSGPNTQLIYLCGPSPQISLTSWCANNPGCSISFVFISAAGCSINPPNGVTVTSTSGISDWSLGMCCCDQSYHAQISGGKLYYWYDCN